MTGGLLSGVRRALLAGTPAAWSPARFGSDLFAAPNVGLMRAAGKLWQDVGETTLATADGEPVRVYQDTFSGGKGTAGSDAARGVLRLAGGVWSLEFDGSNDGYTFTPTGLPTGGNGVCLAVGAFYPTGAAVSGFRILLSYGAASPGTGDTIALATDDSGFGQPFFAYHSVAGSTAVTGVSNDVWMSFVGNASSANVVFYQNAVARPAGTGSSSLVATVGRVGTYTDGSLPANVRLRAWCLVKRRITTDELAELDAYLRGV